MASTKVLALAPLLATALGGCISVSIGRKFDATHVPDIRPCVTTEADMLAWFGEPYKRGNADGLLTLQWAYARAGNSGTESESLVAVVNRASKVVHFAFNPPGAVIEAKDVCSGAGDASAP